MVDPYRYPLDMGSMGAGWCPDPEGSGQLRWWTGEAWTGALLPQAPATLPRPANKGASGCGLGCIGYSWRLSSPSP